METLTELDRLGADLLLKMPEILQKGTEYGGDLFVRFITYSIVKESLTILIGFLLLLSIHFVLKWARKMIDGNEWLGTEGAILSIIYILAVLIFTPAMLYSGIFGFLEAIFIPELYIINTFK